MQGKVKRCKRRVKSIVGQYLVAGSVLRLSGLFITVLRAYLLFNLSHASFAVLQCCIVQREMSSCADKMIADAFLLTFFCGVLSFCTAVSTLLWSASLAFNDHIMKSFLFLPLNEGILASYKFQ